MKFLSLRIVKVKILFFKVNKINIIIVNICMILKKLRELKFFMG